MRTPSPRCFRGQGRSALTRRGTNPPRGSTHSEARLNVSGRTGPGRNPFCNKAEDPFHSPAHSNGGVWREGGWGGVTGDRMTGGGGPAGVWRMGGSSAHAYGGIMVGRT